MLISDVLKKNTAIKDLIHFSKTMLNFTGKNECTKRVKCYICKDVFEKEVFSFFCVTNCNLIKN